MFPVIGCSRFLTETSWRTMDRETGAKGRPYSALQGAETCGGVMVRGPNSRNGTRSSAYYLDSAELAPPRPGTRALGHEIDPLASESQACCYVPPDSAGRGPSGGPCGPWLLRPLPAVLRAAPARTPCRGLSARGTN